MDMAVNDYFPNVIYHIIYDMMKNEYSQILNDRFINNTISTFISFGTDETHYLSCVHK